MICRYCGKQIKDSNAVNCERCGQPTSRLSEGNGFFDILSSSEEGKSDAEKSTAPKDESEKMLSEVEHLRYALDVFIQKQMCMKWIALALLAVSAIVSVVLLVSFVRSNAKIDTLNSYLSEVQMSEQKEQKEPEPEHIEAAVPTEHPVQEVLYAVLPIDVAEEQWNIFGISKEIKMNGFVLGQIAEVQAGKIIVKANVIKNEEKILLASNNEMEINLEQEYDFSVDEISVKGKMKEE